MPRTRACRPAAPSGSTSPQGKQHTRAVTVPAGVASVAAGRPLRLVWTNEAGGLTFEAGMGASRCFIKWAPAGSHLDVAAEAGRMQWAGQFHPLPKPLARGADAAGSWLVTAALDGENAVSRRWKADPATAVTVGQALFGTPGIRAGRHRERFVKRAQARADRLFTSAAASSGAHPPMRSWQPVAGPAVRPGRAGEPGRAGGRGIRRWRSRCRSRGPVRGARRTRAG